jgi:serine/threonine protein kinase
MTEEDIDRLFNRNKSKSRVDTNPSVLPARLDALHARINRANRTETQALKTEMRVIEERVARPVKDFANSVKFLKLEDSTDKLLNGLPMWEDELDEQRIDELFGDSAVDLTAEFKKDYIVGKVVGEGAYASVRVATFRPLSKKVAIKVYEKAKLREPQRKKSVRREIRILQMLDHPNIVKILDVVETNNHLNIIMEYLDGISLNAYLQDQQGHRASERHAKTIIRGLANGLEYLHSRQISHRDIKLENIILSESLAPKLIDFGFSTCIEKSRKVKIFCGTPSYMAPEIVQKKEYRGEPADVWALGVLTFVTLTGIFPFRGATDQELYRKINNA